MKTFNHLVDVNKKERVIEIYRVSPDGEKELYTSTDLPEISSDDDFRKFAQMFGENVLLDSPKIRELYGF